MYLRLGLFAIGISLLTACGCGEGEPIVDESLKQCYYTLIPENTSVNWTAFKTTAKVPVGGSFDDVEITGMGTGASLESMLNGLEFKIRTSSVNTKNPDRDAKIFAHFFSMMTAGEYITGNLKNVDLENGTGMATLVMNGVEVDVPGKVMFTEDLLSFSANLHMSDFNGLGAVNSLNQACYDLHTGDDGESKLWPEVEVVVSSVVTSICE